jgi:hypothetical protein
MTASLARRVLRWLKALYVKKKSVHVYIFWSFSSYKATIIKSCGLHLDDFI